MDKKIEIDPAIGFFFFLLELVIIAVIISKSC